MQLAACYRARLRLREAAALLEQAFARLTLLGRDTTERAGDLLNTWALVTGDQGHPREAVDLYRKAIAIGGGLQTPWTLYDLAFELRDLGEDGEAGVVAARAQAEADRLDERLARSSVLLLRATICRRMAQLDAATRLLDQLELALKGGAVPNPRAFAYLQIARAEVALDRGDRRAAAEGIDRGVEMARHISTSGQAWPTLLLRRADVKLALGRAEEARQDAEEALRLWRSQTEQGTLSCRIGRAALAESRALQALGRPDDARTLAAEAFRNMKDTLGDSHAETLAARRLAGVMASS